MTQLNRMNRKVDEDNRKALNKGNVRYLKVRRFSSNEFWDNIGDQWPTMCPVQTFYILLRGSWERKGFLKVPQPSKLSPCDKGAGNQVEKRKLK